MSLKIGLHSYSNTVNMCQAAERKKIPGHVKYEMFKLGFSDKLQIQYT